MNSLLTQWRTSMAAHGHLFPLVLTLGAYAVAVTIQRFARRSALLNPTLLAIAGVVAMLWLFKVDYSVYFNAAQPVHLLLGPAVVALAIPLYRHAGLVRERAVELVAGLTLGSFTGVTTGLAVAWLFGVSRSGLLSVAPKSTTTAVSMAVSAQIGGAPPVTAVLTILAGIIGAVASGYVLNALRVGDPAIRGFSMGLASHGIATARAFQESSTAGTFAGLAMGLNAVATPVLVPIVLHMMFR
jgi:predicted murein hydrolase (TIGR00659 family)